MRVLLIESPKVVWDLMGFCFLSPLGLTRIAAVLARDLFSSGEWKRAVWWYMAAYNLKKSKCGLALAGSFGPTFSHGGGKDRFVDEKRQETRNEKEEKEFDEKGRRDPISAIGWPLFLIWIGIVLLAEQFGYLVRFEGLETWSVILIGGGVITLLGVLVRLAMPAYRTPVLGSTIFGVILLAAGLADVVDLSGNLIGALVLFLIGGAIIVNGLRRGREP